jgi:hypothetical protein
MATISTLIDRVRLELGDLGKSFVERLYADGTTNRFQLSHSPLDATPLAVTINGTAVADSSVHVEESTGVIALGTMVNGVITVPLVPTAGQELIVTGTHFRYFTNPEMTQIVESAVKEHSARRVDALGRTITVENLPPVEDYPVALYATTLALYTLATDASFDIDISAPDGVMIPRSERYRQLLDMVQIRHNQYRELCVQLGVGLYSIDVFTFRRISKTTNRYVPVYKPQEVDDKSVAQRAEIPLPTYGDANVPWVTEAGQLLAYQDVAYSGTVEFSGSFAGKSFDARLVTQRGSIQVVRNFELVVNSNTPYATVTGVARTSGSGNTVLTTGAAHGFTVGNSVWISDSAPTVLAPKFYTITAVSSTTFTVVSTLQTTVALSSVAYLVEKSGSWNYTATISLDRDSTLRLPNRCWWQIRTIDPVTAEEIEVIAGDFFSRKSYTAIL